VGHCPSHPCSCITNIKQRRRYVKQSLYRLHDIGRGAVSVWRILVFPGECTFKTSDYRERQLHDEALSGGSQPANISRSTVVKRLRLCSCHETLKSLLKNRKWGGLFYLTLSDISGIRSTRVSHYMAMVADVNVPV
jgi:hypothetical protein